MNINLGDTVIDINGRMGFIKSICECDKCKNRGWFEPEIHWFDNPDEYDFISHLEYIDGFKRFKKIGNTKITQPSVITEEKLNKYREMMHDYFTDEKKSKPPLGLEPRKIHDYARIKDIVAAMNRYVEADKLIPSEWVEELLYLVLHYEE